LPGDLAGGAGLGRIRERHEVCASLPHRVVRFLLKQPYYVMMKLRHEEQVELHHHRRPHRQSAGATVSICEFASSKQ
jgi:hypothetical protein